MNWIRSSGRRGLICSGVGCLLAQLVAPSPAYADQSSVLDLNIALSSKAEAKLTATHEGIIVSASYYGFPKPDADRHANEIGVIDLGSETLELPGKPGPVHFSGRNVSVEGLNWIEGPVGVNVNVYSSRKASEDNILNCDFIDGELARAAEAKVTLHCSLIEEELQTEVYP